MASTHAPMERLPWGISSVLLANFFSTFAYLGLVTFAGDAIFSITGRAIDLGLLGLVSFIPIALLSPVAGTVVDRFDRRLPYAVAVVIEIPIALALWRYVAGAPTSAWPIFGLVSAFAACRAFAAPAARSLPIDLAPPHLLERIIAIKAFAFQSGLIAGPVVAGFAAARSPELPFLISAGVLTIVLILIPQIQKPPVERLATPAGPMQAFRDAAEGMRYLRQNRVLSGAISLDLFAVLLGGATVLLPAIAEERLGVGEIGLGWLRAADGIGAASVSLALAVRPISRHIGKALLAVIAVFGLATIVLGLTTSFVVAIVAISILGGADAVSVYIRSSLVPLVTPEVMRGRMIALENVFIGGSNELGSLESGAAAQVIGLVGSIVTGGIGTLAVVAGWWKFFPELRDIDRFDDARRLSGVAETVD